MAASAQMPRLSRCREALKRKLWGHEDSGKDERRNRNKNRPSFVCSFPAEGRSGSHDKEVGGLISSEEEVQRKDERHAGPNKKAVIPDGFFVFGIQVTYCFLSV